MAQKRKSRVEIFKDDIEESKVYHSIESQTLSNSQLLKNNKELLTKLDQDYFQDDINHNIKPIKPLEKAKLFDYKLSMKLQEISTVLTQSNFDIPFRKNLITKMEMQSDIKDLKDSLKRNKENFTRDIDYHGINFNKQISELNKEWKRIEANKADDIVEEASELQEIHDNIFEETKGYKIGLTDFQNTNSEKKEEKTRQSIYYVIGLALLLMIWFMRG